MKERYITTRDIGYQVVLYVNHANKYIGIYRTLEEAIIARDIALKINSTSIKDYKYIDNIEMMKEIIWCKAEGRLSDTLMKMCLKIIKGVSKKFRYKFEEDRFDCEAYATEIIIKNWFQFNEDRFDNPFAYYSEVIKRAFAMQFKILQKDRINTISYDIVDSEGFGIKNFI